MSLLPKTVDPIYILNRDTYVSIDEDLKVNVQRVFLKEIPDKTNKVDVSDGTTPLVESTSPVNLSSGEYYVDYRVGIVHHHSDEEGKTLSYSYMGTGYINYPSTRISLTTDNGDVTKTLKDYVDESNQHIQNANDAIDNMNQVVSDTNEAKNRANEAGQYAETQGDYALQTANNYKTNWLTPPLANLTEVQNTYTSPSHGDTIFTTDAGKVYRYQNGQWDHTQTITDSGISDVQAELAEQEQQTKSLHHGTQVIESDQSSPLKVEFYGNTLVNSLGRIGNFEVDSDSDGVADGWVANLYGGSATLETNNAKYGTKAQRITSTTSDTGTSRRIEKSNFKVKAGKYYIAMVDAVTDGNGIGSLRINDNTSTGVSVNSGDSTTSKTHFVKFNPTGDGTVFIRLYNVVATGSIGWVQYDGLRIYEIDQSTYDKIGVSLTDADVERLFPYVDSVQHVSNPTVKVEGTNLLPPFYEWDLHANAKVKSPYELELNADATYQHTVFKTKSIAKNQSYTLAVNANGTFIIQEFDSSGAKINTYTTNTFTTSSSVEELRVLLTNETAGTFTFSQPMLNLGTTAKPFVPRNPSHLYAEVTLAGNQNEKDILRRNLSTSQWEVERSFEPKRTLTGNDNWTFGTDKSGYKLVKIDDTELDNYGDFDDVNSTQLVKHDGSILQRDDSLHTYDDVKYADYYRTGSLTGSVWLSISDTDSGWTDAMTPTSNMIKAYFNGWQYTGDGTTHSWVSIVDGTTTPSTQAAAFVADPANSPDSYENYFLSYQLAEPVTEVVQVEGDLSIQGDAQIEVGEGVIVREEVTPQDLYSNEYVYINDESSESSKLNNKALKIIQVYKNGVEDNLWVIDTADTSYGKQKVYIHENDYDSTATYTVTYEILDKYDFTTNNNDVTVNYANSLKSSFQSVVTKQSDLATENSILKRQMLDVLVRLDALEGGSN